MVKVYEESELVRAVEAKPGTLFKFPDQSDLCISLGASNGLLEYMYLSECQLKTVTTAQSIRVLPHGYSLTIEQWMD